MANFFTKKGDDGSTGLLGSQRVSKADLTIEVLGSFDELSASLGFARSLCPKTVANEIKEIQAILYEIMAEIAATSENKEKFSKVDDGVLIRLENLIESYSSKISLQDGFILPGDSSTSAAISVARTVTRRAERRLVELKENQGEVRQVLLQYTNRLSSYLFILENYLLQQQNQKSPTLAKKKEK